MELGLRVLDQAGRRHVQYHRAEGRGAAPLCGESLRVDVAASIAEVAEKLVDVVGQLPGKQGEMVFASP